MGLRNRLARLEVARKLSATGLIGQRIEAARARITRHVSAMPEEERAAYMATRERGREWHELQPVGDSADLEAVLNRRKAYARAMA
jgi:hypothetical protein